MRPRVSWALRPVLFVLACSSFAIAQHPSVLPADQRTDAGIQPPKAWEPAPVTPLPEHWQPAVEMPPVPADPVSASDGKLPDRVLHDERGGVLWALGHDYKASFDNRGMTFVPYFGAAAPRNFPIRFTVASVTLAEQALDCTSAHRPQRLRDRVLIDRGGFHEVYDLALRSVEQSFVFDALPATGDLRVRLRAETELRMGTTADGLAFRGEHGSVTYEKAVVFDGAGRREALAIERTGDDQIVLRVPQQFLAAAEGPITIDPIVATFFPATGTPVDFHPDVTFVAGSIVTTWQRVWSSVDDDVFMEWRTSGFVFSIDFTSENWQQPRIAANATTGNVLVVAQVGQPWGQRVIKGRIAVQPNGFSQPFQISGSEAGEAIHCDVGGDPSGLPGTVFCVVWEHAASAGDRNILFRTVAPSTGAFGTPFSVALSTTVHNDTRPRIGKTCGPTAPGAAQFWPVVWQRTFSPTDEDIRGALIGSAGGVVVPSFSIDFASANDTNPVVSSPSVPFGASTFAGGRAFLVAYERTMAAGGRDVHARVFSGSLSLTGAQNLSALGSPTTAATLDQFDPSVDCDGMRFVVAHVERDPFAPTGDNNAFVATWRLAGGLTLHEPPRLLNSGQFGVPELNVSIANVPGTTLHPVVFERVTAAPTNRDVFGALYDSNLAVAPFRSNVGCPLPNIVAGALVIGPAVPGTSFSLFFPISWGPVTNQLILLGTPLSPPAWVCTPCTLLVDPNTATVVAGGTITTTIPASPLLVGTTLAVQSIGMSVPIPFFPFGSCQDQLMTYSDGWLIPIN